MLEVVVIVKLGVTVLVEVNTVDVEGAVTVVELVLALRLLLVLEAGSERIEDDILLPKIT